MSNQPMFDFTLTLKLLIIKLDDEIIHLKTSSIVGITKDERSIKIYCVNENMSFRFKEYKSNKKIKDLYAKLIKVLAL